MKTRSIKRGLYRRETTTTENDDELWQALELLSGDLDRYIQESETLAGKILREAGIDPDTLFDVVSYAGGGGYVQYFKIDADSLSPEADYALKVLLAARNARGALEDPASRGALACGLQLAQYVEHLTANRAWLKPVHAGSGTISGGHKGAKEKYGKPGTRAEKYRRCYLQRRAAFPSENRTDSCKAVAAENRLSPKNGFKTIQRATKGL